METLIPDFLKCKHRDYQHIKDEGGNVLQDRQNEKKVAMKTNVERFKIGGYRVQVLDLHARMSKVKRPVQVATRVHAHERSDFQQSQIFVSYKLTCHRP